MQQTESARGERNSARLDRAADEEAAGSRFGGARGSERDSSTAQGDKKAKLVSAVLISNITFI